MKKMMMFLFLVSSVLSGTANAASTTHYCDKLCPKADGTYFQVRCLCKTVDGDEVPVGACACGGSAMITNASHLNKVIGSDILSVPASPGTAPLKK